LKASELLADLVLGSAIAESDVHLQNYFVRTSFYQDFVKDRADLILGPKGSGKTALFRMIAEGQFDIPELQDTIIFPAFNTQGSVFFQDLINLSVVYSEKLLRRLWTAYILSVVGNYLASSGHSLLDSRDLKLALKSCGLYEQPTTETRSIWSAMLRTFRRLIRPTSIEGRIDLGDGMPGIEGRLEFEGAENAGSAVAVESPPGWLTTAFDPDRLINTIVATLRSMGLRCWVIFDRLDEAFQDDRTLERAALRGLLRAHSDISSYGSALRTKLFLRGDILDRITEESGFVNVTHLRTLTINWSHKHILDMAVRRLISSDSVVRFLGSKGAQSKNEVIPLMMSSIEETAKQTKKKSKYSAASYMIARTVDASAEFNPRNIVSFMLAAQQIELGRRQLNDEELRPLSGPPITMETMIKAWRKISKDRLIDTLYAEHNSLRSTIEKFRNGPQRFDRAWLADLLEVDRSSKELADTIASLKYCGFLGQPGRDIYKVPDLYRPALGLNPKWEDR
jgi:hypothetical protein